MKRRLVIHPFLFASYPIIALYSYNIDQVFPYEIWRSLILALFATLVLLLLLKLLINDWERAGLICTLSLVLFFSYGHVYVLIINKSIGGFVFGRADYLTALWASSFIFLFWFIVRKLSSTHRLTEYLNLISIIALILPGYRILQFNIQSVNNAQASTNLQHEDIVIGDISFQDFPPDIYYIIVDGYGRADVLEELYKYNNTEFTSYLQDKGFCIAENSYSNYAQTALSLASSLNFEYVQELTDLKNTEHADRSPLANLVKDNRVRYFLSQHGYQILAFESGYSVTDWKDADIYITSSNRFNSFETMLISNSVTAIILDRFVPSWYRNRLLLILDQLGLVANLKSPKLVFAHLTLPHPPFIFGPDGEARPSQSFKDGNYYEGTTEDYIEGYQGQITYLNNRLVGIIDKILENSPSQPIIILQSDHGPGAYLNWDSVDKACLHERMAIMNAYYLPGIECDRFDDSISPVNTFPYIFNAYFNTEIEFANNFNYFSLWATPYELIDITNSIDTCNNPAVAE